MTDQRIEGAANGFAGRLQKGFGDLTGDSKSQLEGGFKQVKGKAQDYYGQAIDAIEAEVERAPESVQKPVRQATAFARERPLVTVLGLAAVGLLLTRGSRRR